MKRYSEYKDSGIEWIGKIPSEWGIKKFNSVCNTITDYVASGSFAALRDNVKYYDDENYAMLIRTTDVSGKNQSVTPVYVDEQAYRFLSNSNLFGGEIILPNIGASVGDVYIVPKLYERMTLAPNSIMFKTNYVDKYFYYYFCSKVGRESVSQLAQSAAQPKFNKTELRQLKVLVPNDKTQQSITNYLDHKTSAINTLIADKQKLIELLKEKRQAIISEAVTKGLDKNAKMKDSGIEWIGEIPSGWDTKKFSYVFSFSRGLGITKEDLRDVGVPCVSYGEIHSKYGFEINPEIHNLKCVEESYLETSDKSLLSKGDFVFADTSEDIDGSGNFTHLTSDIPVFAGYHTIIARLADTNNHYRYLAYLFDCDSFRAQIRSKVYGIKVFSITQSILKGVKIILPTKEEQEAIAEYLDRKTVSIDSLITDITAQIEKLNEYRQSIISEAVTGKVAV
jgi:type I restriction enzyme S subunit